MELSVQTPTHEAHPARGRAGSGDPTRRDSRRACSLGGIASDEVERQGNDDENRRNNGGDGEPDAREREERRPRGSCARGLRSDVLRRRCRLRGGIARELPCLPGTALKRRRLVRLSSL